jgi:hypothetical protein
VTDGMKTNVARPMRATVLLAFAALAVLLVFAIAAVLSLIADNHRADEERACRGRITAHAEQIRDTRDSAGWDALADSVLQRQQIDARARAQLIHDLGDSLAEASNLRRDAEAKCAADPSFNP